MELRGLRKLKKKIREKEIVVVKTDKTSKLAVVSMAEYKKLGAEGNKRWKLVNLKQSLKLVKSVTPCSIRTGDDEPKPSQLQSGCHAICGAKVWPCTPPWTQRPQPRQ